MNTVIAICDNHAHAVEVVTELAKKDFTSKQVSILGQVDKVKDAIVLDDKNVMKVAGTEIGIGAALGSAVGILAGVGVFAIPGLGFLYGAGALLGGIAGFDFGLIGGGIVSALTVAGIKVSETRKYDEQIKEGKFLVVVQGTEDEIHTAEGVLKSIDGVSDIEVHD